MAELSLGEPRPIWQWVVAAMGLTALFAIAVGVAGLIYWESQGNNLGLVVLDTACDLINCKRQRPPAPRPAP